MKKQFLITLLGLTMMMPFHAALSSEYVKNTTQTNVTVSIKSGSGEDFYFFSELSTTEQTLVETGADTLQYFQNMQGTTAFEESCQIDLTKRAITTTCKSSNELNQLSVTQNDSQFIYAECNSSEWGSCVTFRAACQYLGGGVGKVEGGGYSCHVAGHDQVNSFKVSGTLKQESQTEMVCAQSTQYINNFGALGGDGDDSDTTSSCLSVGDCNGFIAICIGTGGDFTPDSYEPGSGAPSTGTCTWVNEC